MDATDDGDEEDGEVRFPFELVVVPFDFVVVEVDSLLGFSGFSAASRAVKRSKRCSIKEVMSSFSSRR